MQRRAFVSGGATLAAALVWGCDGGGDADGDGGEGGASSGGSSSGGSTAASGGGSSGGAPSSGGSSSGGSTATGGTSSGGNGSGGGGSCEELEVEIETNHPHALEVPVEDLTRTEPKTYTMTGGHIHRVTLDVEDFEALAAGEIVVKTSSFDDGHEHGVTITCA